jgi:threonine 3-dehydrogenase
MREIYGRENIIASDVKQPPRAFADSGPFVYCDVVDYNTLARVCLEYNVDYIVHMASLLSAVGERNPQLAIQVNTRGLENVLDIARLNNLRVFTPSSIAAFGPTSPKVNTPDECTMRPTTIYGVTKVYTELLGEYYHQRYGVDFRSVRFPGIISNKVLPGGGTTDYAVDIYYSAVKADPSERKYECFLEPDARLPMMYMDDAVKAVIDLLEAPDEDLTQRTYNIGSMDFTPSELYTAIRRQVPDLEIVYNADFRQEIAKTWPQSLDDSAARADWGWDPKFDIDLMTEDMLKVLGDRLVAA